MRIFVWLLLVSTLWSCDTPIRQKDHPSQGSPVIVKYAEGFSIMDHDSHLLVTLHRPYPGADEEITYRLDRSSDGNGIAIPIDRIVCTSTTHLPALTMLGVPHSLVGFPGVTYISDTVQWRRAQTGALAELGTSSQLDVERVVSTAPDVVMAFSMGSEMHQLDKLAELGMKIIYNGDYLEPSILGRAEWIKVIGALYDRLDMADSIFNTIERGYLALMVDSAQISHRPTVMSGVMYGDAWYMPGGNNWGAKVIRDAGGRYLWGHDTEDGWIEISFEEVIDRAAEADLWIGTAHLESRSALGQTDSRYTHFAPYRNKQIYTYSAKKGPGGGITYLELGYARPDLVLADLIKIIHPNLLPDDDLYFYGQLK